MGALSIKTNFSPGSSVSGGDMGTADTLRYNVLTFVVEENYERAIHELKAFLEKDTDYPAFRGRIERYIQHAIDLVHAIRAKRKFPGVQMLTAAKQKELNEKFAAHFGELQVVLKKIERIQSDLRIEDVRSTVWVVRVAVVALTAVVVVAFLLDVNQGLLRTALTVFDDLFYQWTNWLFGKF